MENETIDLPEQISNLSALLGDRLKETQASDPFASQKLYEKWIKMEEWSLRDEALPLVVGIAPEEWSEINEVDFKEQAMKTWLAISEKISGDQNSFILNQEDDADTWRVKPSDYYQWLNQQGITIPDALDGLMQFVMTVVAKPNQTNIEQTGRDNSSQAILQDQVGASVHEKVLSAALNIVAKEPNQCRDPSGLMNGRALAEMVSAQSARWFDSAQAPMSIDAMGELLEKYLE